MTLFHPNRHQTLLILALFFHSSNHCNLMSLVFSLIRHFGVEVKSRHEQRGDEKRTAGSEIWSLSKFIHCFFLIWEIWSEDQSPIYSRPEVTIKSELFNNRNFGMPSRQHKKVAKFHCSLILFTKRVTFPFNSKTRFSTWECPILLPFLKGRILVPHPS